MGMGSGADSDVSNEESGDFSFPKKKQNTTIGRRESKGGRQSEGKSKQRILMRVDSKS